MESTFDGLKHVEGYLDLCLKGPPLRAFILGDIERSPKRETEPFGKGLRVVKKSDYDPVMAEEVLRVIFFGRVIKVEAPAKYLLSPFGH
jgi:hypothetical protein